MEFRPCIDIHNGKVKQIVGGSLQDAGDFAMENFVSKQGAADFARLYQRLGLKGGHIILLNAKDSDYYEATKQQALSALAAYPNGLMVGGGITCDNALEYIEAGASHVIVTSYVFSNGKIDYEHLNQLIAAVGKEHLVLDLSCRKRDGKYYIVTDRWQKFTDTEVTEELLETFADCCDEYLIHAVDVEGMASGIDEDLVRLLAKSRRVCTYAGGVGSYEDLYQLKRAGENEVHVTIGSALDLFGGKLDLLHVLEICKENKVANE